MEEIDYYIDMSLSIRNINFLFDSKEHSNRMVNKKFKELDKLIKEGSKFKMKIKVTAIEWVAKKTEYICEVDEQEYENLSFGGVEDQFTTDEEGYIAKAISKTTEEDWDYKIDEDDVDIEIIK